MGDTNNGRRALRPALYADNGSRVIRISLCSREKAVVSAAFFDSGRLIQTAGSAADQNEKVCPGDKGRHGRKREQNKYAGEETAGMEGSGYKMESVGRKKDKIPAYIQDVRRI